MSHTIDQPWQCCLLLPPSRSRPLGAPADMLRASEHVLDLLPHLYVRAICRRAPMYGRSADMNDVGASIAPAVHLRPIAIIAHHSIHH